MFILIVPNKFTIELLKKKKKTKVYDKQILLKNAQTVKKVLNKSNYRFGLNGFDKY